ncbi:hypothetical protein U1Q18_025621 [Sarracenia purpurea var. burkii]
MDEDEDKGDEGGSGYGEQDDEFSDSSGSDSIPEKGDCEQVEDANQGLGAIQVSLPDSSPACEAGVYTDSERRLNLALEDIRERDNGDENFCAHHMFDKLPQNVCSYLDANKSKPGGILKSGNSNFVPDLGKEGNAGYVAVSEIQGLAVSLSKTQVGAPRPLTGLAPRPSVAQGELNRSWAKVVTSSRGPNLDGGFQRLNQRSSSVDWVRVRKKRNGKKIRVQEERKLHLEPMFEVSREKKNSKLDVPPVGKPTMRPHCFNPGGSGWAKSGSIGGDLGNFGAEETSGEKSGGSSSEFAHSHLAQVSPDFDSEEQGTHTV